MRMKLIGTGNAAGTPLFGCDCLLCSKAKENMDLRRGPASALIEAGGKKYLIDAGLMDIAGKFSNDTLDGVFLTHFHPDHVQGLFHLRWGIGNKIPVFCPPDSTGCADLFKHPGILDFQPQKKFETLELDVLKMTPLPLIHSKVTFGYLFEYHGRRIAYLTDTKGLPVNTLLKLEEHPLELLVIDTSHPPGVEDENHNNLDETLAIHEQLQPRRTLLTHISHDFDVWLYQKEYHLPDTVLVASDGMVAFHY